jgi:pimeloyl-ACP methyl ester carboxylesterase
MKPWKVSILAAGLSLASSLHGKALPVNSFQIQRADDSFITAYVEKPEDNRKRSLLLVLQGSICEDVGPHGTDRMAFALPAGFARLDIEKYDISEKSNGDGDKACPTEYLQHNTIDQRVLDVLTTVASLRNTAPWWNHRLFLMGTSEGATVAAIAGPLIAETRGIVLINGSIGRPFRDGWADAMAASVQSEGGKADEARAEAAKTWEKARRDPTWDEQAFGNGNTMKWWASIIDLRPSNLLRLTQAPILLMQSDHDEMTPVSSARAVREAFQKAGKTNLTYVELPGLTHGLRTVDGKPGWEPVLDKVRRWLASENGTTMPEASPRGRNRDSSSNNSGLKR